MKERSKGFLAPCNIDHESEQFDYIKELHEYLWKFVRCEIPSASGKLDHFIDKALLRAEARRTMRFLKRKEKELDSDDIFQGKWEEE